MVQFSCQKKMLSSPVKKADPWQKELNQRQKNYHRWGVSIGGFFDYIGFLNYTVDPIENFKIITNNLYKKNTQLANKILIMGQNEYKITYEEKESIDKILRKKSLSKEEALLAENFYVPLRHFFLAIGIHHRIPMANFFWENNLFLGKGITFKTLLTRGFLWKSIHWEWLLGGCFIGPYNIYNKNNLLQLNYNGNNSINNIYFYPVDKIDNSYKYLLNFLMGLRVMINIFPDVLFLRHRFLALDFIILINGYQWLLNIQLNTVGKYNLKKNILHHQH